MTPALKKGPGVGNRQENSTHEKFFKKSIWRGKLYSLFNKKRKRRPQTLRKHVQPTAWEILPYRVLLYQADPWEIDQQHHWVGTERPSWAPSPGFFPSFPPRHLSPFVPMCGWTNPRPISSCPGCRGVIVQLSQTVWQKEGWGTLRQRFSRCNMHADPCRSCSNADSDSIGLEWGPKLHF